ncbi:Uncharacterised protein g5020 [Pycnogonum litorale]
MDNYQENFPAADDTGAATSTMGTSIKSQRSSDLCLGENNSDVQASDANRESNQMLIGAYDQSENDCDEDHNVAAESMCNMSGIASAFNYIDQLGDSSDSHELQNNSIDNPSAYHEYNNIYVCSTNYQAVQQENSYQYSVCGDDQQFNPQVSYCYGSPDSVDKMMYRGDYQNPQEWTASDPSHAQYNSTVSPAQLYGNPNIPSDEQYNGIPDFRASYPDQPAIDPSDAHLDFSYSNDPMSWFQQTPERFSEAHKQSELPVGINYVESTTTHQEFGEFDASNRNVMDESCSGPSSSNSLNYTVLSPPMTPLSHDSGISSSPFSNVNTPLQQPSSSKPDSYLFYLPLHVYRNPETGAFQMQHNYADNSVNMIPTLYPRNNSAASLTSENYRGRRHPPKTVREMLDDYRSKLMDRLPQIQIPLVRNDAADAQSRNAFIESHNVASQFERNQSFNENQPDANDVHYMSHSEMNPLYPACSDDGSSYNAAVSYGVQPSKYTFGNVDFENESLDMSAVDKNDGEHSKLPQSNEHHSTMYSYARPYYGNLSTMDHPPMPTDTNSFILTQSDADSSSVTPADTDSSHLSPAQSDDINPIGNSTSLPGIHHLKRMYQYDYGQLSAELPKSPTINFAPCSAASSMAAPYENLGDVGDYDLVDFDSGPVDAKLHRPRHFEMLLLKIGGFMVTNTVVARKHGNKLKVLFSKRKFIYEFHLKDSLSGGDAQFADGGVVSIHVPFKIIEAISSSDNKVCILVNSKPIICGSPKHVSDNLDKTKEPLDFTNGNVSSCPLHEISLRAGYVSRLKEFLELFDKRFYYLHRQKIPAFVDEACTLPDISSTNRSKRVGANKGSSNERKRSNSQSAVSNTCTCKVSCRSFRCSCSKLQLKCSEQCLCDDCDNPLNIVFNSGKDIEAVTLDNCLMHNIYKISALSVYLENELSFGECCMKPCKVVDVIPGHSKCAFGCDTVYTYSWCWNRLCGQPNRPTEHCVTCNVCIAADEDHSENCKKCKFLFTKTNCMLTRRRSEALSENVKIEDKSKEIDSDSE